MTAPISKFTIRRKTWIRGTNGANSSLFRECDGHQCCLGFYLEATGIPRKDLCQVPIPTMMRWGVRGPAWLYSAENPNPAESQSSKASGLLLQVNDAPGLAEDVREAEIIRLFAEQGIEVKFE